MCFIHHQVNPLNLGENSFILKNYLIGGQQSIEFYGPANILFIVKFVLLTNLKPEDYTNQNSITKRERGVKML